jgi:hypothetical protein
MQCPICNVITRNKNFSLSYVREGRRSVENSVKLAVVVSFSLHHQHYDDFHNIQVENAKWAEAVILYVAVHCLFELWDPLERRVLHFCENQRAVSIAKWMAFGPVGLVHSEKFPLHQRHLKKRICCSRDLWLFICPVADVTTLTPLQNLPRPQRCCRSRSLLCNSGCSKPVQISGLGTLTRLSYAHSWQASYWGQIFSSAYYFAFETGVKKWTPYIAVLLGSTFYWPVCLYIHIRLQLKYNPV